MELNQTTTTTTISVLMFPWLAHGHISPYFELAKKLSTRNFKIYICSSQANLSCIKSKMSPKYKDSILLLDLDVPSLPNLPPHCHTTKNLPLNLMNTLKQALDLSEPSFTKILQTLDPDVLIYDFLQPWAPEAAQRLGIPSVNFITSSATMTVFMYHFFKRPHSPFPFPSVYLRDYDKIDLSHLLDPNRDLPKEKTLNFDCLARSWDVVLIKSFKEVEGKCVGYLSELVGKRVLPLPLVQDNGGGLGGGEEDEGCFIHWLDKKKACSTVYVSFGTEYYLKEDEMEEIALGLEQSGLNFIWALRFPLGSSPNALEESLPLGLLERVGDRGMVVEGWVPQVRILKHKSIGGFVSHCGWSSVMEGMKIGVPIVAIPMHIDQPVNAKVVEEVGVGVEVVRDKNGVFDREEVAKVMKQVVCGDVWRKKARELSETLGVKGEEEDIDEVVKELVKLHLKKQKISMLSIVS